MSSYSSSNKVNDVCKHPSKSKFFKMKKIKSCKCLFKAISINIMFEHYDKSYAATIVIICNYARDSDQSNLYNMTSPC